MKKCIIFMKLYWLRILVFTLIIALAIVAAFFINYCFTSFSSMESFSKKQIAGQMALLLPMFLLVQLIATPIMIGLQMYFMQGGFAKMGQSKNSLAQANVKWNEVIGMEEAKKDAWELVELLKDRTKLKRTGGKIIKGMLMMGPPGCGKTYLAKAIATECELPMLSASGSEFIGMFIGVGTARIKSIFKQARALAQLHGGCLIFIDEIDSFARHRRAETGFGGTMDRNATINQFLTELDGLRKSENNIVILAATNCADNDLDSAITRPGRLERKINVTRPNLKERKDLFNLYLSKVDYNKEIIDISILAQKTVWFTPAEIESMVREASLLSQRNHHDQIEKDDLEDAYDRVSFGHKSNITQSVEQKLQTAYHETGHAIIAYMLLNEEHYDVLKATVIPRSRSLGFVFYRPKTDIPEMTKEDLLKSIKISLGSYVVEKKRFNTTTAGVGGSQFSDFAHALSNTQRMVFSLGMGDSGIIGDFLHDKIPFSTLPGKFKDSLYADVNKILQDCLSDVERLINENWEAVEHFTRELFIKEDLDYEDIKKIFGEKFKLQRSSLDENLKVPDDLLKLHLCHQEHLAKKKQEQKEKFEKENPNTITKN